jgi:hypothetical protein
MTCQGVKLVMEWNDYKLKQEKVTEQLYNFISLGNMI